MVYIAEEKAEIQLRQRVTLPALIRQHSPIYENI